MMRWVLLSVVLSGCYVGPVFSLKGQGKRTCGASFLSWGGGLTYHVIQGNGDGSFDYRPFSPQMERTHGSYDLDTGEFWWITEYTEDSYRVQDHVTGYGNIWRDGDLDVVYELNTSFADGSVHTLDIRSQRLGCTETTRIQDRRGNVTVITGDYSDNAFAYTREYLWGPVAVAHEGVLNKEQSWTETVDLENGPIAVQITETGDGRGKVTREFFTADGYQRLRGNWTRERDGSMRMDYSSNAPGSSRQFWTYEVDAEGRGEGEWSQDGAFCDLRIRRFECSRHNCNGVADGECQLPLEWPSPL